MTENTVLPEKGGGGRKRGRPSPIEQMKIAEELRPYFELDMSVLFTARITEINEKTVRRYFKNWIDVFKKEFDLNLVEQQKTAIARTYYALDSALWSLYNDHITVVAAIDRFFTDEDKFQAQAEKENVVRQRQFPHALFKLKKELREDITALQLHKHEVELTPTADQSVTEFFDKKRKEYEEQIRMLNEENNSIGNTKV